MRHKGDQCMYSLVKCAVTRGNHASASSALQRCLMSSLWPEQKLFKDIRTESSVSTGQVRV